MPTQDANAKLQARLLRSALQHAAEIRHARAVIAARTTDLTERLSEMDDDTLLSYVMQCSEGKITPDFDV